MDHPIEKPNGAVVSTEFVELWAKLLKEFREELRASGLDVGVLEPSDTTTFVVTFPQGRAPERVHLPLIPQRSPDLEDIAFEILRQARYKRR